MDLKQVKELMTFMEKTKVKRLKIKTEKGFEVELDKEGAEVERVVHHPHPHREPHLHHYPHTVPHAPQKQNEESKKEVEGNYLTSPMVGTYYSGPSPEDPAFVKVGDEVDEETVVCIVEAMKVMNEVKAGKKGKVAEILIGNGDPVEFGTKMIRIV